MRKRLRRFLANVNLYTDDLQPSLLAEELGALETRDEKRFRAAGLTLKYLQC